MYLTFSVGLNFLITAIIYKVPLSAVITEAFCYNPSCRSSQHPYMFALWSNNKSGGISKSYRILGSKVEYQFLADFLICKCKSAVRNITQGIFRSFVPRCTIIDRDQKFVHLDLIFRVINTFIRYVKHYNCRRVFID